MLSEVTGREIKYISVSEDDLIQSLRNSGMSDEEAGYLATLYKLVREGHMAHVTPELEQLLGCSPVKFEQFARENADIWRS